MDVPLKYDQDSMAALLDDDIVMTWNADEIK